MLETSELRMGKVAVLGDRETTAYFRVSGVKRSRYVKDRGEAEKAFSRLLSDESISLVLVTEPVMEWIEPMLSRHRKEYPLVVAIPTKRGPKSTVDTLAQLVKRTVGVELKVKK
jgi:vacuolar-type H+-ATPase subunit F/Vma7